MPRPGRQASARAAVVPFPRSRAVRVRLSRLLPTRRSLVLGLVLAVAALGAYAGARESSAFAVRQLRVEVADADLARQVEEALAPVRGRSLLELRFDDVRRALAAVPAVAGAELDRAFPHTLRVTVVPERPVAVLRQGTRSWLVAESGRVVAALDRGARPGLPRIWLKRDARVRVGMPADARTARAVDALAAVAGARLPARPASARSDARGLTIVLRSGLELRLGDASDLALKIAVAERVAPLLAPPLSGSRSYLDISVPERPIARE